MRVQERQQHKTQVYLKPGELYFSRTPAVVTTVLGSCVSATFFHRPTGLAAICHAIHPKCAQSAHAAGCPADCGIRFRYPVCAVVAISRQIALHQVRLREIEVKLFGGAALMGQFRRDPLANSLGQQNVEAAMEAISNCGLILQAADVGGALGRKIIFDTSSGEVLLKRLRQAQPEG